MSPTGLPGMVLGIALLLPGSVIFWSSGCEPDRTFRTLEISASAANLHLAFFSAFWAFANQANAARRGGPQTPTPAHGLRPGVKKPDRPIVTIARCLLVSIVLFRTLRLATEGPGSFGNVRGTDSGFASTMETALALVLVACIVVLSEHGQSLKARNLSLKRVDRLLVLWLVLVLGLIGSRSEIAAMTSIMAWFTLRGKKLTVSRPLVGMLAVYVVLALLAVTRSGGTIGDVQDRLAAPYGPSLAVTTTIHAGDSRLSNYVSAMSYLEAVKFQLPWPLADWIYQRQPRTGALILPEILGYRPTSGFGFSIVGESVLNFGIYGPTIVGSLFGAIAAALYRRCYWATGQSHRAYVLFIAMLPMGVRARRAAADQVCYIPADLTVGVSNVLLPGCRRIQSRPVCLAQSGVGFVRFGFMSYASRSGSTLLAQELGRRQSLLVVPEIASLYRIFSLPQAQLACLRPTDVAAALRSNNQILGALRCTEHDIDELSRRCAGKDLSTLLGMLAATYADFRIRDIGALPAHSFTIFKLGSIAPLWPVVEKMLDRPVLIVSRRDPRGIVNSQMRSSLDGRRSLARGSVLRACGDVMRFERSTAGITPDAIVDFASLVASPESAVDLVVESIGVGTNLDWAAKSGFEVADEERALHRLLARGPNESTADAWQYELTRRDRILVELRCACRSNWVRMRRRWTFAVRRSHWLSPRPWPRTFRSER